MIVIVGSGLEQVDKLNAVLKSEGYSVMVFPASRDAPNHIMEITNAGFVLVDCDENSSDINKLISSLRQFASKSITFIGLGTFSLNALRAALLMGFHEYMAKPIGSEKLILLIKSISKRLDLNVYDKNVNDT